MERIVTAGRRNSDQILVNPISVEAPFERHNGEDVTLRFNPPTPGQLAIYFRDVRSGNVFSAITAAMKLFTKILDDEQYELIEEELEEGLDATLLMETVNDLMRVWTTRPTGQSNGSSTSPKRTGSKSTGPPR